MTDEAKREEVANAVEDVIDNTTEMAATWARTGLNVASQALESASKSLELARDSLQKLKEQIPTRDEADSSPPSEESN